jgi:hypothetical protein
MNDKNRVALSIEGLWSKKIKNKIIPASMMKDFIFAAGKIGLGIYTVSGFLCISGLNSIFNGFARHLYLHGEKYSRGDSEKEYSSYVKMALLIFAGSITYTIFMARLFLYSSYISFSIIPALLIAVIAFSELIFSITGIVRTKDLLASALKILNLTSALSAIVLTQIALLSFKEERDLSYINAISGVLFGGISILASLYMIIKYLLHKRKRSHIKR